jgi:hypothetical protein
VGGLNLAPAARQPARQAAWESGVRTLGRFLLYVVLGGVLMFVGHFAAFLGAMVISGTGLRLPYWWAYLVVYPLAAVLAAHLGHLRPLAAAVAVCLLPASYFLALGVLESNWRASDGALLGTGLACLLAFGCASWAWQRHPGSADSA